MGNRSGEDILATDVLAFDVRAFDPSAPIIGYVGTDGVPGTNGIGSIGSDDLILRPSDPGYFSYGVANLSGGTASIVSYGEFVDLDWNGKGMRSYASATSTTGTFSGTSTRNVTVAGTPVSLLKSGLVRIAANGQVQIFQPSYDTFTDRYEYDGMYQAQIGGAGTIFSRNGFVSGAIEPWRTSVDAGADGVDNEVPGDGVADDSDEKETSPPFAVDLRGIQISVRLEDKATKQFKQMSTIKQFVTH
jgi:hypothetical protein